MMQVPHLPRFIAHDLPYHRRVVDVGEHTLHVLDHGDAAARPVLMLHGNPTWSYLWRKVIARLPTPLYRSIAPDLLGFGLSSRIEGRAHSVALHADVIAALIEQLDLRGVILVGQDWGGPILSSVAARVPDRIAGAVFANTAVLLPERFRGTPFHRFARTPFVSDVAFRWLGFPLPVLQRVQGDRASIGLRQRLAYAWPLRHVRDRGGPLALARMVPNGEKHPSMPELRRGDGWLRSFEGPVCLVWGVRDPILGRALARHADALPNAVVTSTEAGHFLQEEVPDDLLAAIALVNRRCGGAG